MFTAEHTIAVNNTMCRYVQLALHSPPHSLPIPTMRALSLIPRQAAIATDEVARPLGINRTTSYTESKKESLSGGPFFRNQPVFFKALALLSFACYDDDRSANNLLLSVLGYLFILVGTMGTAFATTIPAFQKGYKAR